MFVSLLSTPHSALPSTFRRFITTLQIPSLHLTYNYFPNPVSKICDLQGRVASASARSCVKLDDTCVPCIHVAINRRHFVLYLSVICAVPKLVALCYYYYYCCWNVSGHRTLSGMRYTDGTQKHLQNNIAKWSTLDVLSCRRTATCNSHTRAFFRRAFKLRKTRDSSCLSVRMEQLGSHRTAFNRILCLSIFRKSVETGQVLIKSDETSGCFTSRHLCIYDSTSLNYSKGWEMFQRENQNTFYFK
jgi:hypothetical protein